ncbi:MAG: flippase-like domain-containing protein, partial [Firmicutes bacterium]|nr:flippase-like domain-containing protein [Bacillota bacterium]
MSEETGGLGSKRRQVIGIITIIVLLVITIFVIKSRGEEIDFRMIMRTMRHADPLFLVLAVVCMLLYVHIEGRAIAVIARPLGYRLKRRHTFVYASADIYFSAITPSATGGQPASAYYMVRDGMKGSDATTTLVLNILMYTASLIILGLWALAWKFEFLLQCTRMVKLLFVVGLAIQILLLLLCFLCMFSKDTIRNLGGL